MISSFISDILALVFGNISIIMSIAIEFPQLVSIFKTRNTSGTSLATYILFLFASFLWVAWSCVNYWANISYIPDDVTNRILHVAALVPAILSNFINVTLVSFILYFKVRHLHASKKLGISELQYSKILYDKQKGWKWIKKYYPLIIIGFIGLLICAGIIFTLHFLGIPKQITQKEYEKNFALAVLILNIAAATFFEAISWPQFIKCMKTKDTSGISLGWAIFLPLSCLVCFGYDLFLAISTGWWNELASLICSGLIINTLVLIVKIKNIRKANVLGLSEWSYTNKYLEKKKKS